MTDPKPTNAPWIERVTPDGRAGIYAYGGSVRIATVEDAKNGAVIAAAPALLEACVALLRANGFGMSVTGGWDGAAEDPLYIQCVEADRMGVAAVKKARGET